MMVVCKAAQLETLRCHLQKLSVNTVSAGSAKSGVTCNCYVWLQLQHVRSRSPR